MYTGGATVSTGVVSIFCFPFILRHPRIALSCERIYPAPRPGPRRRRTTRKVRRAPAPRSTAAPAHVTRTHARPGTHARARAGGPSRTRIALIYIYPPESTNHISGHVYIPTEYRPCFASCIHIIIPPTEYKPQHATCIHTDLHNPRIFMSGAHKGDHLPPRCVKL